MTEHKHITLLGSTIVEETTIVEDMSDADRAELAEAFSKATGLCPECLGAKCEHCGKTGNREVRDE